MGDVMEDETDVSDDDLLMRFREWNKELSHWSVWREECDEAFKFVAGDQWGVDDRALMEENRRVPLVLNLTGPMVDAVVGAEINGRQEVKFNPRDVGEVDGHVSELLSKAAEWARDECDAETEESAAYRDAFICGLGAMEGRLEYEDEPGGKIVFERVEAGEALPDPAACKPNAIDARYVRRRKVYSRREFNERWPGAVATGVVSDRVTTHVDDPLNQYDQPIKEGRRGDVTVDHWQWYDLQTVYLVQNPMTGEEIEIPGPELDDTLDELGGAAESEGVPFDMEPPSYKRRVYKQAFVAGSQILEESAAEEFSIKFVTGLRDRDKRFWYGIVRRMMDPQRTLNKLYSLGLHILASNAKGGLVAEESALVDQKAFERSWAKADAISIVADGSLQSSRVLPKTAPPFPAALLPLFETAVQMLREAAGINAEMLGQVDKEQPGVVEVQRKQAAYGILASFFDGFRRYRRQQGKQLLRLLRYLPDNTLVRITDEEGSLRYVPLAFDDDVQRYDVIVDEVQSGPNHRERVWQQVMQLMPLMVQAEVPPKAFGLLLEYSPLPESVSKKFAEIIAEMGEPDQDDLQNQQLQQIMQALGIQGAQAEIADKQADANLKAVEADSKMIEAQNMLLRPDPEPQSIL